MNSYINRKKIVTLLALAFAICSLAGYGQVHYAQNGPVLISIAGTSTLHEWTMTSKQASYDAVLEANAQGEPTKLTSLTYSVLSESLKSEKHAMDKNAYAALKTDKNKQITFQLLTARIEGKTIQCTGKLTIAGTTKQIEVDAAYTVLPGNSLQFKGSKKLAMKEYNVEPPSFMFGTVTTGNEITVSFEVTLAPGKLASSIVN